MPLTLKDIGAAPKDQPAEEQGVLNIQVTFNKTLLGSEAGRELIAEQAKLSAQEQLAKPYPDARIEIGE